MATLIVDASPQVPALIRTILTGLADDDVRRLLDPGTVVED
jgi:hypothetical protein